MAHIVIDARLINSSTGRYSQKLIQRLDSLNSGNSYTILIGPRDTTDELNLPKEFNYINTDYPIGTFAEQYSFVWELYGIKNDLVHFTMTQQPVLYFGKSITTIHDLTTAYFRNPAKNRPVFWLKQKVYRWVIKRVAKKSAQLIVPSNYVKNQLAEFADISPSKISVTYEAADKITDAAEPVKGLKGENFIMYVGRPLPHKNLERLVEGFVVLRQSHPKLKLVLVGKKDILYDRLEKKIKKQGTGGVVFTGFASEGSLRWLYENTAAYVFPSLSEGFGLPALEAMAHGAPVVSSDATCLPEIYGNGALYFDPLNIDDMAAKISQVLDDSEFAKKLAAAGLKQAAKYSWRRTAEQTLEIYKKLTS